MIVTLDASILVRATKRSRGPARRVIDALASNPDHVIALSPFILGEVGKVLSHPRMQTLFRLTADEVHDHLEFLRSISRMIEPAAGGPIVLTDPNDDPVVYTAVAGGADVPVHHGPGFLCFERPRLLRVPRHSGNGRSRSAQDSLMLPLPDITPAL